MGKKSSKTKSTSKPWGPAQPYLLGAAGTIQDTVNANQGNLNDMAANIRGFLPGLGEKAFGDSAGLGAANNYAMDVLGGKYLGANNPYLNQMAATTRGNVADQVNSMFSKAGRVGSDRHFADLGRGMSEAENSLRYQDYANERGAMTQAAGMMPSLEAAQYAGVAPYLAANQTAAGLPYTGLSSLGLMGNLFGGYGTQTQQQPGGWGNGLLSAAASLGSAAIMASDPKVKVNVQKVGELSDGLGVYDFDYLPGYGPEGRQRGVMADEVAILRPHALGPVLGGVQTVDYSKLGEAA